MCHPVHRWAKKWSLNCDNFLHGPAWLFSKTGPLFGPTLKLDKNNRNKHQWFRECVFPMCHLVHQSYSESSRNLLSYYFALQQIRSRLRLCRTGKEYLRNGGGGTSMPVMHALQPRNLSTYRFEKGLGNGEITYSVTIQFMSNLPLTQPEWSPCTYQNILYFVSSRSLPEFGGVPSTKLESSKAPSITRKNGIIPQNPLVCMVCQVWESGICFKLMYLLGCTKTLES